MMVAAAAAMIDSATGEMGRTAEHPIPCQAGCSAPPVSPEGMAVSAQVIRVASTLGRRNVSLAQLSTGAALRFAAPVRPDSWAVLAQAVFPNSRAMTREERRAFDAGFWPNLEPIEFPDD
jgi:hypothetical protein